MNVDALKLDRSTPAGRRSCWPSVSALEPAETVGLGQLVPQRGIAPQARRDARQRVAAAHRVHARHAALIVAGERGGRLLEVRRARVRRLPEPERAGALRPPPVGDRAHIVGLQRAVVAGIAHLHAIEPVPHLVRIAADRTRLPRACRTGLVAPDDLPVHVAGQLQRARAPGGS